MTYGMGIKTVSLDNVNETIEKLILDHAFGDKLTDAAVQGAIDSIKSVEDRNAMIFFFERNDFAFSKGNVKFGLALVRRVNEKFDEVKPNQNGIHNAISGANFCLDTLHAEGKILLAQEEDGIWD